MCPGGDTFVGTVYVVREAKRGKSAAVSAKDAVPGEIGVDGERGEMNGADAGESWSEAG